MKSFLDKHNKTILKKHTNRLNKDDEKKLPNWRTAQLTKNAWQGA